MMEPLVTIVDPMAAEVVVADVAAAEAADAAVGAMEFVRRWARRKEDPIILRVPAGDKPRRPRVRRGRLPAAVSPAGANNMKLFEVTVWCPWKL